MYFIIKHTTCCGVIASEVSDVAEEHKKCVVSERTNLSKWK